MNEKDPLGSRYTGDKAADYHSNGQEPGAGEDRDTETKAIQEPHVEERRRDEHDWPISCVRELAC